MPLGCGVTSVVVAAAGCPARIWRPNTIPSSTWENEAMTTYDNTNTGILFRNDRRENERQPEFTGTINVDGIEYWLSAWVKASKKDGRKFFSLAIKPKQEARPASQSARPSVRAELDDEIPF
jgi:hypothetical protein